MARGRRSTQVKTITGKDAAYLKQLGRTGISTACQAITQAGLSVERVSKLANSGFIKESNITISGRKHTVYQLTPRGQHFLRVNHGFRTFPQSCGLGHAKHDVKLTDLYYQLPDDVKDTWRCERELVNDIYRDRPELQGNLVTCVDATVVIDEKLVAVESIGDSYTQPIMEIKMEIAKELLGCEEMIKA